jgi:peptide chain release factor 2
LEAEGGIKSATVKIEGEYAYGYLKGESGVHRLVRISPFDAAARRTRPSLRSIFSPSSTIPSRWKSVLKTARGYVSVRRRGGAARQQDGQRRPLHPPAHGHRGRLPVRTQPDQEPRHRDEHAQGAPVRILPAEKEKENEKFAQEKKDISWGNQIRSYVFQPYTMVKDARTKFEVGNIQAVMDGDIDPFIEEYLRFAWKAAQGE